MFLFSKSMRILKRRLFLKIGRFGKRFHGEVLCFSFIPGDHVLLGITVSKKYGNAVKRNHFKRRIRELFRTCQNRFLHSIFLSIMPKSQQINLSYDALSNDFENFLKFLANNRRGINRVRS